MEGGGGVWTGAVPTAATTAAVCSNCGCSPLYPHTHARVVSTHISLACPHAQQCPDDSCQEQTAREQLQGKQAVYDNET
jgi:hypothetical protein